MTLDSVETRAWGRWPAGGGHMASAMGRESLKGREQVKGSILSTRMILTKHADLEGSSAFSH